MPEAAVEILAGPKTKSNPVAKPGRPAADRSRLATAWYRVVQGFFTTIFAASYGLRASGREQIPASGPVLLVSNHLSHLDVLVLGILLDRPLNFVARSSLFFWPLGPVIRSLGAFPINRDGMGAEGFKETLRRVKKGGIVTLFPEGTRTGDGNLGEIKPGIARLVVKTRAVVVPAAIAGTFESWPKTRAFPRPHPLRVHFGEPISTEQIEGLGPEELTELIRRRIVDCQEVARRGIARDLAESRLGDSEEIR